MAPAFELQVLRDEDGMRARLGIPELPSGEDIGAAAFVAWHEGLAAALTGAPAELPTLYQVWLKTGATGRTGRAVYFEAGGEQYFVFASLAPALVAQKLPAGWLREKMLPAQKESTGHAQRVIPRVEDASPGVTLGPADDEGNIPMSAQGFEDLFAGTDVELEARPFTDAFARELRELAGAAAHAKSCGRALHLRHF